MTKKVTSIVFISLLLIVCTTCKTKVQVAGVNLEITFSEELSDNLLVDMFYTWKTNENFEKIEPSSFVFDLLD